MRDLSISDESGSEGTVDVVRSDQMTAVSAGLDFPWRWVWSALVTGGVAGGISTATLWGKDVSEHSAAMEVGMKVAAAVLAILATFIAVHRLRLSQKEHARQVAADQNAKLDAIERRITELSAKASEQLGSDKATVQIGGLTDLERLAQNYPSLRQVAVDRICAYLQMPIPLASLEETQVSTASPMEILSDPVRVASVSPEAQREIRVRLTAQRILARHLRRSSSETFWPNMSIDLSGAVLIDFDMSEAYIDSADFRYVNFVGQTTFNRGVFAQVADFSYSTFYGWVDFTQASFDENAGFEKSEFRQSAAFDYTEFGKIAYFQGAKFCGGSTFGNTSFGDVAHFDYAEFGEGVTFVDAMVSQAAVFEHATFKGYAGFSGVRFRCPRYFAARFEEGASFNGARFIGNAKFGSMFHGHTTFEEVYFDEDVVFMSAHFEGDISFDGTNFNGGAHFARVIFDGDVSFHRCIFGPYVHFGTARFARQPILHYAKATESPHHVWPLGWGVDSVADADGLFELIPPQNPETGR
ncbi:pentapeptide repeat-containing protein [Actinoallomurus purpureus]|uniref:pentapeptide repeat-containing protein n=1 Tax=Actinoallomurus purpureus TaxID=478114 RepID=UPI002092DBC6|nr:pentapeptide repeat-containing protein [Actinoallomurus purpureus]MCO6010048.1 pentapeptide repeat-containing protein [Actinoallomurus purpureus]